MERTNLEKNLIGFSIFGCISTSSYNEPFFEGYKKDSRTFMEKYREFTKEKINLILEKIKEISEVDKIITPEEFEKKYNKSRLPFWTKNLLLFDIIITERKAKNMCKEDFFIVKGVKKFTVLYDGFVIGILYKGKDSVRDVFPYLITVRKLIKEKILEIIPKVKIIAPTFVEEAAILYSKREIKSIKGKIKNAKETDNIIKVVHNENDLLYQFIGDYMNPFIGRSFSIFELIHDTRLQIFEIGDLMSSLYKDLLQFSETSVYRLLKRLTATFKMQRKVDRVKALFAKYRENLQHFNCIKSEFFQYKYQSPFIRWAKNIPEEYWEIKERVEPDLFYKDTEYIRNRMRGFVSILSVIISVTIGAVLGSVLTFLFTHL